MTLSISPSQCLLRSVSPTVSDFAKFVMSQAPSLRSDRLSWVVSLAPPIWHFAEIFSENDFSQFGELGRKYTASVEIAADPSVPEICQPAAAFVDRSPPL